MQRDFFAALQVGAGASGVTDTPETVHRNADIGLGFRQRSDQGAAKQHVRVGNQVIVLVGEFDLQEGVSGLGGLPVIVDPVVKVRVALLDRFDLVAAHEVHVRHERCGGVDQPVNDTGMPRGAAKRGVLIALVRLAGPEKNYR
ncbi:hypothetical protein D3C84_946090 [compost metagenome]